MMLPTDPKMRICAAVSLLLGAIFSAVMWIMFGVWAAVIAVIAALSFCCVFFAYSVSLSREINELSNVVDRLINSDGCESIDSCCEGELAVLESEIRKVAAALRESECQLKRERAYLTDSIADISHQLRTPLTSINIMLSMLSDDGLSTERRAELLRSLRQMVVRIDWLIETLLKMAKIDSGTAFFEHRRVDCAALIKKATQTLEMSLDVRGQRLCVNVGQEYFVGDIHWTAEAITNILKNCMEHNREGGSINISVRQTNIFTEFLISDEGDGFDEQDIPHLFERFYKGKNASESSVGIGLALASGIILNQNGTIKAANLPNGGAAFIIRFYFSTV